LCIFPTIRIKLCSIVTNRRSKLKDHSVEVATPSSRCKEIESEKSEIRRLDPYHLRID